MENKTAKSNIENQKGKIKEETKPIHLKVSVRSGLIAVNVEFKRSTSMLEYQHTHVIDNILYVYNETYIILQEINFFF